MLVLSRTEGRSIWFGRNGTLTVERITAAGDAVITLKVPANIAVSVGATQHEYHAERHKKAHDAGDMIMPYGCRMCAGMHLWVGASGRIMVTEVDRGQVKIGFDLPHTEAVTRDDYPRHWHDEQQALREQRRPHATPSRSGS